MNDAFPVENYNQGFVQLRSGLTIYPSQDRAIDSVLDEMIEGIPARFALLTDVSGQIISAKGDRSSVSEPVALGSLVAGDLAASREVARLLGEYQSYQMTLREGSRSHTFTIEAGAYMALVVQVPSETPLGWARIVIRKAAERLAEIVEAPPEELQQNGRGESHRLQEALNAADNISDLFGDALDSLWSGGEGE